jgi:hypothetical protein
MVFLDHCLFFWEFVHPLTWNQALFVVASSPSYIRWRYEFTKFTFVSHSGTWCLWTTQNHQFCCIFWRWRIHTPVCCGSRIKDWVVDVCNSGTFRPLPPPFLSISTCLLRVCLQYAMELVAWKILMLSWIVLFSLELHNRRRLRWQFL